MQVPFSGFQVPSLLYLLALGGGLATVVTMLSATRPPVTQRTVVAWVPWVVAGAALHVFYQLGTTGGSLYPAWAAPLFAAPAVYVTTFLLMGAVWVGAAILGGTATETDRASRVLGLVGTGVALALLGVAGWQAAGPGVTPRLVLPAVTLIGAAALTFVTYVTVGAWRAWVLAEARVAGAVVLFAHLLDAVSTAVAVDVLGTAERSAVPARIIAVAGDLPTADLLGSGWLFVAVKLAVAVLVVVAFADYVSEDPVRGNLLFGVVAAVGLGPAVNNLLLMFLGL